MTIDDVVAALFRVLCDHQRAKGTGADMSLAEIRLARGVTEGQLTEATKVIRFSGDLFIVFTTRAWDRVTPGQAWLSRCEDEGRAEGVRDG